MTSIEFAPGGYRFVPGVFQYSAGVAAIPGFRIERARFARPVPLAQGFDAVDAHLARLGRPPTAFCACELRSPAQFSEAGFIAFNRHYVQRLEAWGIFKNDVNPNVLAYEPSPGKMTELFQSGQAVLAVWGTGRVQTFANTGFPIQFVYPTEGAVTLLTTACPISKPNASPLASAFIKLLLEQKVQLLMLKDYGYGPVLKSIAVPPELVRMAPVGERAAKLYTPDWTVINEKREEWTKRWNREVER